MASTIIFHVGLALFVPSLGFQQQQQFLIPHLPHLPGQRHHTSHSASASSSSKLHSAKACAPLANRESYFSVDVGVGTPPQTFAVVADTGSDAVIIPSCACKESGYCNADAKCFTGTNKSSSFWMSTNGSAAKSGVPIVQLSFGSGDIEAVIGSDVVEVAGIGAMMADGVLLMVQNQLQVQDAGGFQGIIGLGPPKNETALAIQAAAYEKEMEEQQEAQRKALEKAMKKRKSKTGEDDGDEEEMPLDEIMKNKGDAGEAQGPPKGSRMGRHLGDGNSSKETNRAAADLMKAIAAVAGTAINDALRAKDHDLAESLVRGAMQDIAKSTKAKRHGKQVQTVGMPAWQPAEARLGEKSFLESTGVSRFSICFRDQGRSGALRLQPPKAAASLGSVGTNHWGLDFRGVSVGSSTAEVKFCSPGNLTKGQETACGGIPDSGTTLLMAPREQIEPLYEDLCDNWDRCRKIVDAGLGKVKAEVFQLLMNECAEWKEEGNGFDELPPMYFHVAGAEGTEQTLRLDPSAYVFEMVEQETVDSGQGPFSMPVPTGKNKTVCMPGISGHDLDTEVNGPIWILGSPLFHQYNVGYEADRKHFKGSIYFEELDEAGDTCGCEGATDDELSLSDTRAKRRPRTLHGPPRVSRIDVSLGL